MRIKFQDKDLQRTAEDSSYAPKRWSGDLVRAYRKKLQVIRAVTDERGLYGYKSLHFEQLKGDRKGTSSIRLNSQFRLILRIEVEPDGRTIVVIEVVDYH